MMTTLESYLRRGRVGLRKWTGNPGIRLGCKLGIHFLGGMILSAVGLAQKSQPFTMGLLCTMRGWQAVVTALGGGTGYLLFWGHPGTQGLLWLALALTVVLVLGSRKILEESPLLMSAIGALIVSASGLIFQILMEDTTTVPIYLLRVVLGGLSVKMFEMARQRDPVALWLASGTAVLALAQVVPFSGFSLGYVAAGALAASGTFPAAALAGLALDLAQMTQTPMTAVLCISYLTRLIPVGNGWVRYGSPGVVYLFIMALRGGADYTPVLPLVLGGLSAVLLPRQTSLPRRRGETGLAQVRLEMMSGALFQTQSLLLEAAPGPIDEEALLQRTRERACGGCPCRKTCRERLEAIPVRWLHRPLLDTSKLDLNCKKPGRMILELRRSQEQLRAIRANRQRLEEYRGALVQQYQFLGNFLQQLADQLPRRGKNQPQRYQPEVAAAAAGVESANGDRLIWFSGIECRYYILLCDGMGTGIGAAQAGQTAAAMLRQMLSSGFPAEYALRSVNSLMTLTEQTGAVTMDLVEVMLDSGRATIYKWGAAPSYLLREDGVEKIGTAGPPPGLSVSESRETVQRLSLRRGEVLILASDGMDGEAALTRIGNSSKQSPGELATRILECGGENREDDATVAVIRLIPNTLPT